ncbi:MAG: DNA repair exonuclease [Pseudomonadota bacterium]
MGFRFLHTADWQLGRPFASFEPDLAARLKEQRLDAIDRLADLARQNGAQHVLVAGDVWDQATPADSVLLQPIDIMAKAGDLHWWLLPGNHDPAGPASLWERLAKHGLPKTITPLTSPEPQEVDEGVSILPAPWFSNRPGRDLTADFDRMATPPGYQRIGLAHGSVQGFGSDPDAQFPIAPDRAERSGLAYLALGDWHGTKRVATRTWYAGTPEPDRFRNNDAGHALLVDLDQDEPQRLVTKAYAWDRLEISLDRTADVEAMLRQALSSSWPGHRRLVQLALAGDVTMDGRRTLQALIDAETPKLAYLDLRDGDLAIRADEVSTEFADPVLADTAQRLASLQGPDAGHAQDALLLLDRFARGS